LAITRAGASTTAELTAVGCPSILVPSPNVTDNHQEKNARALEKLGATKVILENGCSGDLLYETVKGLVKDKVRLTRMSNDAKAAGKTDAADKIASVLIGLIN
jgi:UDP-N-acetylglucosamine--N-acetylmuramyl-(pentapeptide) pyrophosphoryl-undecaprenol N-acetylglucosamine transferase